MGDRSAIEWTDATWSPITGCTRVSAGCENCYAERMAATRLVKSPKYEGVARMTPGGARWTGKIRLHIGALDQPLRWTKPRRIFVNSMSDTFHEDVPDKFLYELFAVMALAESHTFQVLTKRADRMAAFFDDPDSAALVEGTAQRIYHRRTGEDPSMWLAVHWPLPNVWLGTSVEDQATADERIPHLLSCPAAVRFLSCEPLLGPVNIDKWSVRKVGIASHERAWLSFVNWVIAGGESGPGARPMHPDWARSLRDQCVDAGVAFHFKQWGEWVPTDQFELDPQAAIDDLQLYPLDGSTDVVVRLGKKAAGRELDGRTWDQFPKGAQP